MEMGNLRLLKGLNSSNVVKSLHYRPPEGIGDQMEKHTQLV